MSAVPESFLGAAANDADKDCQQQQEAGAQAPDHIAGEGVHRRTL